MGVSLLTYLGRTGSWQTAPDDYVRIACMASDDHKPQRLAAGLLLK